MIAETIIGNGLIHTNENCIGCNRCIMACSIPGANISIKNSKSEQARIKVNGRWCITCGACLDACDHKAREFEDDTERFFRDLKDGVPISLLIAPAFKANYSEEYERILGGLKALGVRHMISVSFGADIAMWAYIKYIREHDFYGCITNPCPVVVDYIEKYEPQLIPSLIPTQTPLMCAAIYARKKLGLKERFAFISPCIGKKIEIEEPGNKGLVEYNVTFEHLMQYVREHQIYGEPCSDEVRYDLGTVYPMPGGLSEYARFLTGEEFLMRQIEGEDHLFEYLHENAEAIHDHRTPFSLIDALNCQKGCLCGTAVEHRKHASDDMLYHLAGIRKAVKQESSLTNMTPDERMRELDRRFSDIDLNDYLVTYRDKSKSLVLLEPSDEALEAIFHEMEKNTDEDKKRNCSACGYQSCREMATAIYNGLNQKENCVYYLKNSVKKQNRQLRYVVEHDELLNVYNRRTILQMISELPEHTDYVLVFADINGFKGLNETYGQKEVNKILFTISEALKEETARFGGVVGRVKSDEFIILFTERKLDETSPEVQAVKHAMESKVNAGEVWFNLTASLGIVNSERSVSPERNFEYAEMAAEMGKTADRTTAVLYGDELKEKIEDERRTKELLLDAIENDGFYMVYQPQVDTFTREVCGYEALVRMKAPNMYPGRFIPVAEKAGLIWKIGRITTELVIRQIAEWRDAGYKLHPVSINFSSLQMNDDGYLDFFRDMMKTYNIPTELVEIEITESLFIGKTDQANNLFGDFKSMGISLLMDDFGTGYSSLGYLAYIPVDIIKLDKLLVDNYLVEGKDQFIKNVIGLVHDLGKTIIVEGVETAEQVNRLADFGADAIQGYYFSKPVMPDEAIHFRAS